MSAILMKISLPTVDSIIHNAHILFWLQCSCSCNKIVQWFDAIGV